MKGHSSHSQNSLAISKESLGGNQDGGVEGSAGKRASRGIIRSPCRTVNVWRGEIVSK